MLETQWFSPYDNQRRIGSVIEVLASQIKINLTLAGKGVAHFVNGQQLRVGEINEYIFIDVGATALLGKLTRVWLDGAERLSVEQLNDKENENHPTGLVQPLATVKFSTGKVQRGISQYPRLGAQVYAAHPQLVAWILTNKAEAINSIDLPLGHATTDETTHIYASPEQLFSRHCAVLGSTGSGKSNTVAKLIELVAEHNGKALLIDATGEYEGIENCESCYVGNKLNSNTAHQQLTFPYWQLMDSDLYALLRPSGQVQLPKLIEAIRSLKALYHCSLQTQQNYTIFQKANADKSAFNSLVQYVTNDSRWDFNYLAEQIQAECVYPDANFGKDTSKFGGENINEYGHCMTLVGRINAFKNNPHMKWLIVDSSNNAISTISDKIISFMQSDVGILRIDLSAVPFDANAREILVNAIGRCLLNNCRSQQITPQKPLLVFIDEAHQFISKSVGDDANKFSLDAFGNIAKEGRKYGLNVVISTQRPRDVPEDVLSQIGTFFVHRLTNPYDQELVKRSIGDLDQNAALSLPTLGTGEALLLGTDFNFSMRLKIKQARKTPESESVTYSKIWKLGNSQN